MEFARGPRRDVAVSATAPHKSWPILNVAAGLPERGWVDIGNGEPATRVRHQPAKWKDRQSCAVARQVMRGETLPESARRHGIRPLARHVTRTGTGWCAAAVGSLRFNSEHDRNLPDTNRIPDKDRFGGFSVSIRLLKRPIRPPNALRLASIPRATLVNPGAGIWAGAAPNPAPPHERTVLRCPMHADSARQPS